MQRGAGQGGQGDLEEGAQSFFSEALKGEEINLWKASESAGYFQAEAGRLITLPLWKSWVQDADALAGHPALPRL